MTEVDMEELLENLAQCRRCGICRNAVYEEMGFDGVCPVWRNSTGFETSFMRGRIQVAQALLDGRLEKTAENVESLFTCTLCGNCTEMCAAEFDPTKTLEMVRQVFRDVPNDSRDAIAEMVVANLNPYETDNRIRRNWIKEVGFDIPTKGETLYYVGCTAGLRLPSLAKSTAKILKTAGTSFAVLEEEPCCGSVLTRTGKIVEAQKNAEKLASAITESGAKRIVVSCAGCLRSLKKDFPEKFGIELPEVFHIVEYANELIMKGSVKPKDTGKQIRMTYHDPCHLGKEMNIYDAPREVLKAIPGVELVEMETIREAAMCCGAGGGLRSYDSDLAKKIAGDRIKSAESTGAEVIATSCPFCVTNLEAGRKQEKSKLRVVDIIDLLAESL
jgi:heterodisulfide reductase subunit D